MPVDPFKELRAQLGDAAPESLRQLSDDDLRHLAKAIAEAQHRQAKALATAGDHALSHIPRILRGPVRRIVG